MTEDSKLYTATGAAVRLWCVRGTIRTRKGLYAFFIPVEANDEIDAMKQATVWAFETRRATSINIIFAKRDPDVERRLLEHVRDILHEAKEIK